MSLKPFSLRHSQSSQQQQRQQNRSLWTARGLRRSLLIFGNRPFISFSLALLVLLVPILLWHRLLFPYDEEDEEVTIIYKPENIRNSIETPKENFTFTLLYGAMKNNLHYSKQPRYYYPNDNNHNHNNYQGVMVDDILDAVGERLEISGHRIEHEVCFAGNQTHLSLRGFTEEEDEEEEEKEKILTESVFLVRGGCDISTLMRDMAQFFAWQEDVSYNNNNNNNNKPLHVRTVQGDVLSLSRLTKLIVDVGNRDCDQRNQTQHDLHHILHWIRVATGLFQLQPWWNERDIVNTTNININTTTGGILSNDETAVRYVMIDLRISNAENSALNKDGSISPSLHVLKPLRSLQEFSCAKYILLADRRPSRWFHSKIVANRFRLRWIHYMHYSNLQKQKKHYNDRNSNSITAIVNTALAMWGKGPLSPILWRLILAAVTDEMINGTSDSPYYYYYHHNNNGMSRSINGKDRGNHSEKNAVATALAGMLREASILNELSPLTITVIASQEIDGEPEEEERMMSFLYDEFGYVSRVQLIYLPGTNISSRNNTVNTTEEVNKKYSVVFVQDYLELLRLLVLTDVLIVPHGVALASTVVMQPGSVVIELFPYECRSATYAGLATAMQITYTSYEGSPYKSTMDNNNRVQSTGFGICFARYNNKPTPTVLPSSVDNTFTSTGGGNKIHLRYSRLSLCDHVYGVVIVTKMRLYHLVKNALSSLWLRNSRFFGVMSFDRR
ncbi:uncharacterized protein TM35_000101510 [Trypanosoma theileri]|uniref:Glycosyltransferase n=1 Tax=Trypanosoma theileri TaxID=67003 RepID=A0A1X0NZH2_9TRYP|nr:uncharacterized protein TM35_000101510 [Trypanosoma theileri]ORC89883.1 hypothetical protein TM35_000101510 [Trypanosoma theileri]